MSFSSRLHDTAVSARLGRWVGICFLVAFVTGLFSHYEQLPVPPVPIPTTPSWLFQVTQGVHVAVGTAAIPLLLVKLWSVYPLLFRRPPMRPARELLLHLLERASIGVLVATALFELASGVADVAEWYPWHFYFRGVHGATAYVAIGALAVHVAVKLPVIREALAGPVDDATSERDVVSRRTLLRSAYASAAVLALATASEPVPVLRRLTVLGTRSGRGPQDLPVNRTAVQARVHGRADDPSYRLVLAYAGQERQLSLAQLRAMPQHSHTLPIACVEGWSRDATWTGVRVRDLVALVGAGAVGTVEVTSFDTSANGHSTLPAGVADDDRTLLALSVNGEPLDLDHGFPCRVIAPDRPGVLQTKWVRRMEVTA